MVGSIAVQDPLRMGALNRFSCTTGALVAARASVNNDEQDSAHPNGNEETRNGQVFETLQHHDAEYCTDRQEIVQQDSLHFFG